MRKFRPFKPGIKLLAKLEVIAAHINESCPECQGKVVLYFGHKGKHKPYYPTHEECLNCGWRRDIVKIYEDAGLIVNHPSCRCVLPDLDSIEPKETMS